jgi:chaperone modulatory protein CbpM
MNASPGPVNTTIEVAELRAFTVTALCRATGADADQLRALVGEGVLQPIDGAVGAWQFNGHALARTRTALRLARDFELDIAGVALVMDLLAEIEQLRSHLHRMGVEPPPQRPGVPTA